MPPTAFGSFPLLAVPVVILGPLALPLGIFAPCSFWLFGSALPLGIFAPCAFWLFGSAFFGSFLLCWALWALLGALWPSLCVFAPCALWFCLPCPSWPFLSRLGLFGSPWGPLVLPWASLPLCAFWLCLRCSLLVFFVVLGPFGLSMGPFGPLLGVFVFCAFWLCLPCPLGSFWFFCVAVGSLFWAPWRCALFSCVPFGLFFGFLPFLIVAVWPPVFCARDMGAHLWAFCGFALSFSFLPRSVPVPDLACLWGAFACAGPLAGVPVGLEGGLCCLLGYFVPLLGFI